MRIENPHGNDTLSPYQTKRLAQWLPSRQPMIRRLWAGKGGRKLAIKLQCLECCGEDTDAVRSCNDRCCPLWHFRPFQTRTPNQHNLK